MINLYLLGLQLALTAYVYSQVLTQPEMLLNPFYNWLRNKLIFDGQDIYKPSGEWLFKPLIGCFYCVAGQFALWGYLIAYLPHYNLFEHVFFISFTIFAVQIFHKIYEWKK